jgi:hypothetical protein
MRMDLPSILLGGPKFDDGTADVFSEIEAERKANYGRAVDLEAGTRPICSTPTCCRRHVSASRRQV